MAEAREKNGSRLVAFSQRVCFETPQEALQLNDANQSQGDLLYRESFLDDLFDCLSLHSGARFARFVSVLTSLFVCQFGGMPNIIFCIKNPRTSQLGYEFVEFIEFTFRHTDAFKL